MMWKDVTLDLHDHVPIVIYYLIYYLYYPYYPQGFTLRVSWNSLEYFGVASDSGLPDPWANTTTETKRATSKVVRCFIEL